jgi:nucleotide-binding universal stress UspA family protein
MAATARLCLKARPTPAQLADRLRPVDGVWPDGLELYLAAADLASPERIDDIVERITGADVPADFAWLIEGPVDSLDGADFDVARDSDADLAVLERLADLARRIHARAVNIHVISPSPDTARLSLESRAALLNRALPLLARFVDLVQAAGAVPTVENMPPVLRMRRSDFAFTPIGMAADDLWWLVERLPGLRVLADTSHAGLYLNARRLPPDPAYAWSAPLTSYLRQLPHAVSDLVGYLEELPTVENAQVSNARGILGEGLAYGEGDFDLDPAIAWLGAHVEHIVAETIEASNDDAILMRDALRRMRTVLV